MFSIITRGKAPIAIIMFTQVNMVDGVNDNKYVKTKTPVSAYRVGGRGLAFRRSPTALFGLFRMSLDVPRSLTLTIYST